MPWDKTPADRRRDAKVYGPEYRRNRDAAKRRDSGRCVLCGSKNEVQVDHVIPVTQGGTHALSNLRCLCGNCHRRKTVGEGGGYRANRAAKDPAPTPRTKWLPVFKIIFGRPRSFTDARPGRSSPLICHLWT